MCRTNDGSVTPVLSRFWASWQLGQIEHAGQNYLVLLDVVLLLCEGSSPSSPVRSMK